MLIIVMISAGITVIVKSHLLWLMIDLLTFTGCYRPYDITEYWCDTTGCYIRNDVIVIQNVMENMIKQESK